MIIVHGNGHRGKAKQLNLYIICSCWKISFFLHFFSFQFFSSFYFYYWVSDVVKSVISYECFGFLFLRLWLSSLCISLNNAIKHQRCIKMYAHCVTVPMCQLILHGINLYSNWVIIRLSSVDCLMNHTLTHMAIEFMQ